MEAKTKSGSFLAENCSRASKPSPPTAPTNQKYHFFDAAPYVYVVELGGYGLWDTPYLLDERPKLGDGHLPVPVSVKQLEGLKGGTVNFTKI